MFLIINPPSEVDAQQMEGDGESNKFALNFYKSRKYAYGHVLETVSAGGESLGRYLIRVSPNGSLSLENLGETFEPAADSPTRPTTPSA